MRTNIVIDDALMSEAMRCSGAHTKKEAVERGLELLVAQSSQLDLRELRGKYSWEGDLDAQRCDA